jgi:protein-S-isoprenylcysteine O-methyltransferase Ste14
MQATKIEFRLRMAINAAIIILGFTSPWIELWGIGRRISMLEWLALQVSRLGIVRFSVASNLVVVAAASVAALGAVLRVWGTAYLGPGTVNNANMKAGAVIGDGPYRYVRNPLYLGLWCMVAALSFLMPPTGALVTMILISIFMLRLTLGEEAFLATGLGQPYRDYVHAVPRFTPRLRTSLPSSSAKPQWIRAMLTEATPIGVFVALAAFSWSYDNRLMIRVILIFFGFSLVVRALMPGVLISSEQQR